MPIRLIFLLLIYFFMCRGLNRIAKSFHHTVDSLFSLTCLLHSKTLHFMSFPKYVFLLWSLHLLPVVNNSNYILVLHIRETTVCLGNLCIWCCFKFMWICQLLFMLLHGILLKCTQSHRTYLIFIYPLFAYCKELQFSTYCFIFKLPQHF